MGADHIELLYVYSESLEMATANAEDLELDIDFVQCDIRNLGWRGSSVDTVIMNPPFGTRRKGADMEFLSTALKIASGAVYSLHTRDVSSHIKRAALR
ncbi:unnamed protein product [Linum tenue]|nr:unnamed protein product [Linum tenue]